MAGKQVLILGGGWGGLMAAQQLRALLSSEHRVVVVERNTTFSLCLSNLWLMTGEREHPRQVQRELAHLSGEGIEWVQAEVRQLDPAARTVYTDGGSLHADYLVIALGADLVPDQVPGFVGATHNLYDVQSAYELRGALAAFERGRVVVLITRAPFRCPAAPYEAAFLVDWLFRQRGIRERVEIAVYTPEKQPMAVTGPAVGAALREMLAEREIAYYPEHTASRIDAAARAVHFDGDVAAYDLLIGIPPHRAPRAVAEAGLTDATGYIPAHPQTLALLADPDTLETRYPGVFALGDVASIRLLNGMLLPKTGVFAEEEARVVAANIAAEVRGTSPSARFDGSGSCYVEVGDGKAAYGVGNFYAYPGPRFTLEPPTPRYRREKESLERVLETWFAR